MSYDSLRPYLEVLEKKGLFRWITAEVDKDWEISSIARMIFRGLPEERRFGIGFSNVRGFPGSRVVCGAIAASTEMVATGLECAPTLPAIHERMMSGISSPIEAVIVRTGPCKEVILGPDELDLLSLPVPIWTPSRDAGPYMTPLWITKDPDTGMRDIGIRRCQIKGRNTTGILFGAPDRGGAIHHAKWRARGKPMPAAIYIGADPVQYLVAPSRYGQDELAVAGGIRGRAVELVKCETVDIEVPATAEFVIEGEVTTDYVEPEGPFGEFTGFMAGGREAPVFKVKCITHRKNPILLGVLSQFPPSESSIIKRALLEASLLNHLREKLKIPGIADVHALESGGCTATLWVSIKKLYTGHVDQIAFAIWGYFGTSYYKWIIVTDDDVDIRDPFMRDWAFSWIVRPDQDVRIIPHSGAVELDPSTDPPDAMPTEKFGAKAIIDATRKWKYPAISLPPQKCIDQVLSRWGDYGLPPLDQVRLPKGI